MDSIKLSDIIGSMQIGEAIKISYVENLQAITFEAQKKLQPKGPIFKSRVMMSAEEFNTLQPELKELYVKNTIKTVLSAVKDRARQ